MHRVQILKGDITKLAIDAIVNAANEWMLGGGGVDGAIHDAAGPELLKACRAVPEVRPGVRCPTGECRITSGFLLPARYVIHTVGPVWHGGQSGESTYLESCYRTSLELARKNEVQSIAFPAISCGVFGYPPEQAAAIAIQALKSFLDGDVGFKSIILVAYDTKMCSVLQTALSAR